MDFYENEQSASPTENPQDEQNAQPIEIEWEEQDTLLVEDEQEEQTDGSQKTSPFADSPYEFHPNAQTAQKPKAKKKPSKAWKGVVAAGLAAVLVVGSCGITASVLNSRWEDRMEQMTRSMNKQIDDLQERIASGVVVGSPVTAEDGSTTFMTPSQVYAKCKNSIVAITNQVRGRTASTGSGFIVSEDGYIVSNHHVVDGAETLIVTTHDGEEYTATLVGSDAANDVALLKIEAESLPAVTLGSSDALAIGDQVVAIGNPLGELTSTQTVGYVSGKDRSVSTDGTVINMLQTDAAINPGNSGGALFNMYGQVVGITTAKYSGTTSSGASIEGIGFAIPINDVKDILEDLKNFGYVTGAYLGVQVRDMNAEMAAMYNLPIGAYVDSVEQGSCAEKGGIRGQDIILGLDDYEITSISDLTRALRKFDAGDTVTVTVLRAGREMELTLTLDEKPHDSTPAETEPAQPTLPSGWDDDDLFDFFERYFGRNG